MSKKKILFLHGALGAASQFDSLISLNQNDYDCIAIDFPGHGHQAPSSDFSIDYFTHYLIQFVQQHFNEPIDVFGYSMGGYIALNAASQQPNLFKQIMTLGTKFDWNPAEGIKQAALLNADKIAEKLPHYAAYLTQLHPAHDWKKVVNQTAVLIQQLSSAPPLSGTSIAQIDIPICVGLGDRDQMVSLNETVDVYKQCKQGSMYVVPNMHHPIEKMNPDKMLTYMQWFFS